MKFNVAIDGPSGAGKSVIALRIAKRFNLLHINSGAMYRAIAYKANELQLDVSNEELLANLIDNSHIKLTKEQGVLIDGKDITLAIRNEKISKLASDISKFPKVREKLVYLQQQLAKDKNCIMEGRDITTVVLPDAEVKIYLTSSVDIRAKRRTLDLLSKGFEADFDKVKEDIIVRDYQDMNRDVAPLRIAEGAVVVDSSHLSIDETLDEISKIIEKIIKKGESSHD